MALEQPITSDPLNVPDHSLMHRQVATDAGAAVKSLAVNSDSSLAVSSKTARGVKVDSEGTPTYGWKDLKADIKLHGVGANEPAYSVYIGGIRAYQFSTVNDECFVEFHIPHDYAPGTDIYIHAHWSLDVGSITGGVTWDFETTYAKGHDQAPFITPVTPAVTQTASTTAYQHMIAEVQLSAASPSGTQIDSDNIETDGLILVRAEFSATTLSGGETPWLHFVDIHYQSTNMATKNKAPNFYTT